MRRGRAAPDASGGEVPDTVSEADLAQLVVVGQEVSECLDLVGVDVRHLPSGTCKDIGASMRFRLFTHFLPLHSCHVDCP